MTFAHVSGLPVEETLLQLAPAGVALAAALRIARERLWRRRGSAGGAAEPPGHGP
jgi:hypothetical protein